MDTRNNSKEFSILEPFGHFAPESKIERYWKSFNGPFSLHRQRVQQFSTYSGMTYVPIQYNMSRFSLASETPDRNWVFEHFKSFVRTEFTSQAATDLPIDWKPDVVEEITVNYKFLDDFLMSSEWVNRYEIPRPDGDSPADIAKSIFEHLGSPQIGSGANLKNNNLDEFIERIVPTIQDKSRLLFVLPGFPFKDQNRFRVDFDGSIPDMAEISFMIRLYNLTQTLYQIHPYAADIVILTDGFLYKDIFGVSEEVVAQYEKRLAYYRNHLNLQGAVSFISLKEMIDRTSDEHTSGWKIYEDIKSILTEIIHEKDNEIIEVFNILVAGMKWNLDSRKSLAHIQDRDCWDILRKDRSDIDAHLLEEWDKVHQRSVDAAIEYAAVNLMLRRTGLISLFFPEAIRATIHPKPGQFALAGSGNYAWNGVAWSKEWPKNVDDIRVVPFMSLTEFGPIKRVRFLNSDLPAFYTRGIPNKNITTAKYVLPVEGWVLDDILGRPFTPADRKEYITLGINDKNYSWERRLQNESYFTALFDFRLNHYQRYGFGIQGIWKGDKLLGQFGLQVLNEELDQVEFVIFLGKDAIQQGIGTRLMKYLIQRACEAGLTELYGVVRSNNAEGMGLIKKLGGKPQKTIKHFNHEGIVHLLTLLKK